MQVPLMASNSTTNGHTSNDMHLYNVLLVSMTWRAVYFERFIIVLHMFTGSE